MERISKHTYIESPAEKVFGWFTDPVHLPEIWPSMVEVSNVQRKPDGAHSYDWTYKMAGMKFHGHADTVDAKKDRLVVDQNKSGIPSTFRWTFEPYDKGTEVGVEVEYEIPVPLLGRLAAPFLRKLNEREAETVLQNLKERMELGGPIA